MTIHRESHMGVNAIYMQMLVEQKQKLEEAITSSNSIHGEVETVMKDFVASVKNEIDAEAIEEKLRDLEKMDLTSMDKKILAGIRKFIGAIQKATEDFDKFNKGLKYEYVVSKKGEVEAADDGEEVPEDIENELESGDEQFEEPAPEDEVKIEGVALKAINILLESDADVKVKKVTSVNRLNKEAKGTFVKMNKDQFATYLEDGPFYVVTIDGEKYFCHPASGGYYNGKDEPVKGKLLSAIKTAIKSNE